jgi:signal peptidase complex subunit 2
MAKNKKKQNIPEAKVVSAKPQEEEEEFDEEEDPELLLAVDVGDTVKVKQILEETAASALLERVDEDVYLDNIKLSIMALACVFAMLAQFAPVPFPESRPILGVCCCLYFALTGVLQLFQTFIDKDCFLNTKPLQSSKNELLQKHGLRVRSDLPRFSEWFTVILEFQGMPNSPYVEQKWSIGQFFDVEGNFDEDGLEEEMDKLLDRLEAGKYDGVNGKDDKKKQA